MQNTPNTHKPGQPGKQPNKTNQPDPKGADRGKGARHDEGEDEPMKTRTKDAESGDETRRAPGADRDSDVNSSKGHK